MKQFALMVDGRVAEIFDEFLAVGEGDEAINVPLSDRYDAEFLAQLVPYDAANPPPEPLPEVPSPEQNALTRDGLLAIAALRIAPLQDAVDLEEATDAEQALLAAWKRYRIDVNRADMANPQWPTLPDTTSHTQ